MGMAQAIPLADAGACVSPRRPAAAPDCHPRPWGAPAGPVSPRFRVGLLPQGVRVRAARCKGHMREQPTATTLPKVLPRIPQGYNPNFYHEYHSTTTQSPTRGRRANPRISSGGDRATRPASPATALERCAHGPIRDARHGRWDLGSQPSRGAAARAISTRDSKYDRTLGPGRDAPSANSFPFPKWFFRTCDTGV
jgi:hypothetical protein